MKIDEVRRAVLRELIHRKYSGVARHFALAAGKPDGQINDMLSSPSRKSFGEKIARQLERATGLPEGYLDRLENAAPPGTVAQLCAEPIPQKYYDETISEVIRIMERLNPEEQREILGAARYIEYEAALRQKKSALRPGQ